MKYYDEWNAIHHNQKIPFIHDITERISNTRDEELLDHFIMWLGGQHHDLAVYGIQLLFKYHNLDIEVSPKAQLRLNFWKSKLDITEPYRVDDYEDIIHYSWPQEYMTDFEERLYGLEVEETSTVDMILIGVGEDEFPSSSLIDDCVDQIINLKPFIQMEKILNIKNWIGDNPVYQIYFEECLAKKSNNVIKNDTPQQEEI